MCRNHRLFLGLACLFAPVIAAALTPPPASLPAVETATASGPATRAEEMTCFALQITGLLPGNEAKAVTIYLRKKGARFTAAAEAPEWNRATHTVDASKVRLGFGINLRGPMTLTLNPDHWIPQDGKPLERVLTLDARLDPKKGTVQGTASTTIEGEARELPVTGQMVVPIDPKNCEINFSCEDALPWGENFRQRMTFAVEIKDGKPIALACKTLHFQHGQFSLPFNPAGLTLTETSLAGDITFTIKDLENVEHNATLTLKVERLGDFLHGTFTGKFTEAKSAGPIRGIALPPEKP